MTRAAKPLAPDGFLRSPLKLIGAKTGQTVNSGRSIIYKMMPKGCSTYVEPFLGSGSILIGSPDRSRREIVSDLQPYVINFFQVLQAAPYELWDYIEAMVAHVQREQDLNTPGYRYFHYLRDNIVPPEGLEGAVWFYAISKCCMNGIFRFSSKGNCNSSFCGTYRGRGFLDWAWYWEVYHRIERVHFFNWDYRRTLELAPEDTFVCLDPPYRAAFTEYDRVRFLDKDHEELAAILREARFKWLLTINDDEFVRKLYKDFHFKEIQIHYSCSQSAAGRGRRPELFITNYEVCPGLHG